MNGARRLVLWVFVLGGAASHSAFGICSGPNNLRTCSNPSNIVITDSASPPTKASPYPSTIDVAGVVGNTSKLTVSITGLSHDVPDDVDMLLVAPTGQSFLFFSDAGGNFPASSLTITLDDSAAVMMPDSTALSSGTFKPTNFGTGDTFPAPAPATGNLAAPAGSATFASVFNGLNPNGTWSLYIVDDTSGTAGSISGGWTIAVSSVPAADLTVSKTHSGNFTRGDVGKTYTITVANGGAGATSGTVTMVDTLPTGLAATAISGTGWSCDLPSLACFRSDVLNAAASYPPITLTVTVAANAPSTVTNTATVSGGGESVTTNDVAMSVTAIDQSDLTITKMHSGNFSRGDVGKTYTITVANAGAGATSGSVMVVDTVPAGLTPTAMAGTGWSCDLPTRTCMRSDALPSSVSYPVITLTVNVALNAPSSVINSVTVSGGSESNTMNDSANDTTTVLAPDLTVTKMHSSNFTQGEAGRNYTITVTNSGFASSSGTVTVVDTLPAGLTATALSGNGWICSLPTLTCTRPDSVLAGSIFPAITLTVSVSASAPGAVVNSVTVSGGSESNTANDTANDPTTIDSPPGGSLIPDGRSVTKVFPVGGSVFRASVSAFRTYVLELDVAFDGAGTRPGGGPAPVVTVTRGNGGSLTTTPVDRSGCAPGSEARLVFTPDLSDTGAGPLVFHVNDSVSAGYRYRLRLAEASSYCPFWSTNGYSAFLDVRNSSSCSVTGQVTLFNSVGAAIQALPFTVTPGAATQIAIPAGLSADSGSAQLIHNGASDAIQAGIYMVAPMSPVGLAFRWPFLEVRGYGATDGR